MCLQLVYSCLSGACHWSWGEEFNDGTIVAADRLQLVVVVLVAVLDLSVVLAVSSMSRLYCVVRLVATDTGYLSIIGYHLNYLTCLTTNGDNIEPLKYLHLIERCDRAGHDVVRAGYVDLGHVLWFVVSQAGHVRVGTGFYVGENTTATFHTRHQAGVVTLPLVTRLHVK